mgnify:CR=1 FL=1
MVKDLQSLFLGGFAAWRERISSSPNLQPFDSAQGIAVRVADLSEPNGRTLLINSLDLTSLAMLAGWATPTTMASAFSLANRFLYLILRALEPS